jgi:hypothetical protein
VITRLLLRCYPRDWRARYGDELEELIRELRAGRRLPLRIWANTALGGGRERLSAAGLSGDARSPDDRSRAGLLLVLCAWTAFVVGGISIQKLSEHWQNATPVGSRAVPRVAFDVLVGASVAGTILVLAGIACALPALAVYLRQGGWPAIRRPIVRAVGLTLAAGLAAIGLVVWAHSLTTGQRNGGDLAYGLAFAGCALLGIAVLAGWTVVAVRTCTRVALTPRVLRVEARLALGASASMLVMTASAITWWVALTRAAPWFLAGQAPGTASSGLAPVVIVSLALMLLAASLGSVGARRAWLAASNGTRRPVPEME